MSNVNTINEAEFQGEVLDSSLPVFVDFWAPWCGYCQRLLPILDELSTELDGKAKVITVNVDANRGLAQKYGIMSLPTLIMFKGGAEVEKMVGYMPKANILAKIEPHL